ncbi:MAG: FtsW/RodA/SpoVE family cell cycle protein, partial [Minisyncoccales bacterium]
MLRAKKTATKGDKILFFLPLGLSLFGLLAIFDISSVSALRNFGDSFHYVRNQFFWLILGLVLFLFFSFIDYKKLKKFALPLFLVGLLGLVLVLIPGIGKEVYGGKRWFFFGFFNFQPSEFAKFALVIYLATLFEKKREFLPFLIVVGLVLSLLVLEPDLGTAMILVCTSFGLYFLAGAPASQLIVVTVISLIVIPCLILFSNYRRQRLITFLTSSFSAEKASYHVKQILIALGAGGIFGRGFGQSRQKFLFLPEVTTDSIFAVIGEEFGFVGGLILIMAFFFLIYRYFRLALFVKDPFAKLLVSGVAINLSLQILTNLGAMVALIPLTGIPLPFISYGGSSLLVCLLQA